MAIWIPEDAKVIVQGITGRQGRFHADKMVEYGTAIVGGCTPGKGGQTVELQGRDFPVWNSVRDAVEATDADATVIYVPLPLPVKPSWKPRKLLTPSRARCDRLHHGRHSHPRHDQGCRLR